MGSVLGSIPQDQRLQENTLGIVKEKDPLGTPDEPSKGDRNESDYLQKKKNKRALSQPVSERTIKLTLTKHTKPNSYA